MLPDLNSLVTPGESSSDESPLPSPSPPASSSIPPRVHSMRSISDPPIVPHPSSTPLALSQGRRGAPTSGGLGGVPLNAGMRPDLQAKLQAFQASRMQQGAAAGAGGMSSPIAGKQFIGGRPVVPNWSSAPAIAGRPRPGVPGMSGAPPTPKPSLAQRRMNFPGGLPGAGAPPPTPAGGLNSTGDTGNSDGASGSLFDKYSRFVDAKSGSLTFNGKAVLHGKGVDFSSGSSIQMSLDEIQTLEELGKGNYGTVYRVIHRKKGQQPPRRGSFNVGRCISGSPETSSSGNPSPDEMDRSPLSRCNTSGASDGQVMAMKEIRLELDENKFAQIIMELDVLHRCRSPYIIDFYGAFFQEGAVYICMEHMDGGSIDKLYRGGVPEGVLRKIAYATIVGLKTLKEDHNIIHRDVKPTNILVNTRGDVKLCDFGVSGNLVASIAKTNIGCQSYMAPERIASGGTQASVGANSGPAGTYGVQSDIWSLGLSILECAMGCYPYPPETYNNIFSQLSAIVDGQPPDLPEDGFTPQARDFVRGCLHKIPKLRPTYAMLLQHPWIIDLAKPETISEEAEEAEVAAENGADFELPRTVAPGDSEVKEWVTAAMDRRKAHIEQGLKGPEKPALHAAPLDAVPGKDTPTLDEVNDALGELKTA
ncbi:kinase-like domain-containing protein [Pyronema domesticum]|nr:kinase-like domain-containing protein [Pyronema domesticum]